MICSAVVLHFSFFACWIDTVLAAPALHQCLAMIDAYDRMLAVNKELVPLTREFQPEGGTIANRARR